VLRLRHCGGKDQNLPRAIQSFEKSDAAVIGDQMLPHETVHQIQRFAGVKIVENDGVLGGLLFESERV